MGVNETFISVIVPAHNAEATLEACLASIAASTFEDFEVILVDDGSEDATAEIAAARGGRMIRLEKPRGPAHARNLAAEEASGAVLFFTDADCVLHPHTLGQAASCFRSRPDVDAVIGSYDEQPAAPNFISQFKNLFHHYVHQTSDEDAWTFWTGCGAIRRDCFMRLGGFDGQAYPGPSIEDIEFGYRLKASGGTIRLLKNMQVQHLKTWSLSRLLKTDIFDRGVPWTRLLLSTRSFRADLNLQTHNRWSVVLVWAAVLAGFAALWDVRAFAISAAVLFAALVLNRRLYVFFASRRGLRFAVLSVPLHFFYYFYNGVAFALGILYHLTGSVPRSNRTRIVI